MSKVYQISIFSERHLAKWYIAALSQVITHTVKFSVKVNLFLVFFNQVDVAKKVNVYLRMSRNSLESDILSWTKGCGTLSIKKCP